jgi:hypothetical protein
MLTVADRGASEKHGSYESRSALLFAFLTGCIAENIADDVITEACLDECYRGKAIWEHCYDQRNVVGYLDRQLERAEEKYAKSTRAKIEQLAALSLLKYEQQRKQAAAGLSIRVGQLDRMVEGVRQRAQAEEIEADTAKAKAAADKEVAAINANHALILVGNKALVVKFEDDTKLRPFKAWFANQWVWTGTDAMPLGHYWLTHAKRRQYSGLEFAPPGTAPCAGYYNLWQGFAVEPRKGDCSRFLAHLRDNVARGDKDTFLWIVGWWAQTFQYPSVKTGTALALRGEQGTGKTKVGEVFGSLLREHYRLVASPRYVTGQFNSHMASLLVLHADEAFWAGSKEAEGTLKDLVTGKNHQLEYKGVD